MFSGKRLKRAPTLGKMVEFTSDGIDVIANVNVEPYYSEIEFGEVSEWQYWSAEDKSQPQKLYSRSYSLGGLGLTLGVRFVLWKKSEED